MMNRCSCSSNDAFQPTTGSDCERCFFGVHNLTHFHAPQVFESMGHDKEATVKALLGMATDAHPASSAPAADRSADGASSSRAPEESGGQILEPPPLWDSLPEECKQLVLERLSPLDAARAVRVSG